MIWDETKFGDGQNIEQVWFPGMHSNVGGGYHFYGRDFTEILRLFFLRHIGQRQNFSRQCFPIEEACAKSDLTTCERSCKGPDGMSCSSRFVKRAVN
jgi:hypothetical protein